MDPVTVAGVAMTVAGKAAESAAGEAAEATGGLLVRLVGPSVDVIGQQWADRLRERNLGRLLRKTQARQDSDGATGTVSARLAAKTFEEVQYADDEIVAEYLAGILASSRGNERSNDAGIGWTSLVARMSSDELRLHYLVYASARPFLARRFKSSHKIDGQIVLVPSARLLSQMFTSDAQANNGRLNAASDGLVRESLLAPVATGQRMDVRALGWNATGAEEQLDWSDVRPGHPAALTIHGIRFFLWAMGKGTGEVNQYLDAQVHLDPVDDDPSLHPIAPLGFDTFGGNKALPRNE